MQLSHRRAAHHYLGLAMLLMAGFSQTVWAMGSHYDALTSVAVSRDGSQLVAGGDNLTLYVFDPQTLAVKQRVWIEIEPREMFFSKDGKVLAIESSGKNLYFYDTDSWKLKNKFPKAQYSVYAADADILATLELAYKKPTKVKLFKVSEAQPISSFEVADEVRVVGVTPDAQHFVTLSKPQDSVTEKRESTPKELRASGKRLEKFAFEQQHDTKSSVLRWFNAKGEEQSKHALWYSPKDVLNWPLMPTAEAVTIFGFWEGVRLTPAGEIEVVSLDSYNYGIGSNAAQNLIASGTMRKGLIAELDKKPVFKAGFELDRLATTPEYFQSFSVADDNTAYGVTNAYRLVKINPDSSLNSVIPVQ